jgi:hypothetical protein
VSDVATPVDVGFEGDGFLGGADGVEHGGEDLVAVKESGAGVSGEEGRAEEVGDGLGELRIGDGEVVLNAIGEGALDGAGGEGGNIKHET